MAMILNKTNEFPENLITTLRDSFEADDEFLKRVPRFTVTGVRNALEYISDNGNDIMKRRVQEVILYFEHGETLKSISEKYDISSEKVRSDINQVLYYLRYKYKLNCMMMQARGMAVNNPESFKRSIKAFDLSDRSVRSLERGGIHTLQDLVDSNEFTINHLYRIGKKQIDEIFNFMRKYGLEFKGEGGLVQL